MTEEKKFIKAPGCAKYKGDVTKDVLGTLMGPTTFGTYVGAFQAEYDETTDITTVKFEAVTGVPQ